jgi:hypothetical protein
MTGTVVPRPTEGDVVELILDDHRLFEALLRLLRDQTADRAAVRADLSAVLVAHAEAEEAEVYPVLARRTDVDEDEVQHSTHEHDEGHEALLPVLTAEVNTEEFGEAVEQLSKALSHHLDEEERDILNPARTEVDDATRADLGAAFAAARAGQLDQDCGSVDNVRRRVERARRRDQPE